MAEKTSLSILLKRYRLGAGLSQEALAERAGLSTRAVSDLERGLHRSPRLETLNLLAQALSLSSQQRALLLAAARPELHAEGEKRAAAPSPPSPLSTRSSTLPLPPQG